MKACCIVEFCRNNCPILSTDAEVLRASGLVQCEICGQTLYRHPTYAYPTGMGHVVRGCDGKYYHL